MAEATWLWSPELILAQTPLRHFTVALGSDMKVEFYGSINNWNAQDMSMIRLALSEDEDIP